MLTSRSAAVRFALVIALATAGWAGLSHAPPSRADTVTPATKPAAVPIVELRGSGDQIGTAHGTQELDAIHLLHDKYLTPFIAGRAKRFVALSAASMFEAQLRPEHKAEVLALAKSTAEDERETMLGQCFLDLAQLSACSTFTLPATAAPDGVARFGRNLDFPSLDMADKYTTLFVVHGDGGRYAFAAVGWPGMVGVLSGMNEHGLCLANMEVKRSIGAPHAMPYTLLYRTVLERCRTVDEAVDLLNKTARQTPNNLMLMDATGTRAVVEITPDAVHVRKGVDTSVLISTNHQRDQDRDTPGKCDRYDYLHDAGATSFGSIDEKKIEAMLGRVGNRSTLQSMVFEPANRVLYLSAGKDASHKPFARIDLKPLFAK